mgnify:CR=1 FL=1
MDAVGEEEAVSVNEGEVGEESPPPVSVTPLPDKIFFKQEKNKKKERRKIKNQFYLTKSSWLNFGYFNELLLFTVFFMN